MESTKSAMEDVDLQWNPKKRAVTHVKRGGGGGWVHSHSYDAKGDHYKFLGVLESVRQEERMSLDCAAREFFRRMFIIWSSPLSYHSRVTA